MTAKIGWPPGLLQDDDKRLSKWLATRPGARYQVRKNIMEQQPKALRLADDLERNALPAFIAEEAAAELRRLHESCERLFMANKELTVMFDNLRAAIAAAR